MTAKYWAIKASASTLVCIKMPSTFQLNTWGKISIAPRGNYLPLELNPVASGNSKENIQYMRTTNNSKL